MKKMSVTEARAKLDAVISAAERGEYIMLTKYGKDLAIIGPPQAKAGTDRRYIQD